MKEIDKELERYIRKDKYSLITEISTILYELSKNIEILGFNYEKGILMVKEKEPNDYIRIILKEKEKNKK